MVDRPSRIVLPAADAGMTFATLTEMLRSQYIALREAAEGARRGWHVAYEPRSRWDGGFDKYNRNAQAYTPFWPRLTRFVLQNRLDPLSYLRQIFLVWGAHQVIPLPNQTIGPVAWRHYCRMFSLSDVAGSLQEAFKAQCATAVCAAAAFSDQPEWPDQEIRRFVLLDETLQLSALFRYCLAVEHGLRAIAQKFCQTATFQYFPHPDEYDAVWGPRIPAEFRRRARELFSALLAEAKKRPTRAARSGDDECLPEDE